MTELSGTFEGVGLPAIVRFLSGLRKTGCLRIAHHDWRGEIYFDTGQVIGASLGSRQGLDALDGLVQVLPSGTFTFDGAARLAGESNISLNAEALQVHLDELAVQIANGTSRLPSLDVVPAPLAQDSSRSDEEPLAFDRGTLQTLLAVDGERTVRDIVAQRGSLDALWHLASLAEVGLVQFSSNQAAAPVESESAVPTSNEPDAPPEPGPLPLTWDEATAPGEVVPAAADPQPVALPTVEAIAPESTAADASVHCPKLGFEDDSSNSFGRPTRLHRCFAAGTPLPLSLDQQRELCLTERFATCPRLTMGGSAPTAQDAQAASGAPLGRRPGVRLPDSEVGDARIVRLPSPPRANLTERGVLTDRQAVGGSEPTRFRSAGSPVRDRPLAPATDSTRATPAAMPMPLRARLERATAVSSGSAEAESPARAAPEPRASEPKSLIQTLVGVPANRRVRGMPIVVIAGGSVLLVVLALIAYLITPYLGEWFAGDTLDTSALPNTSAVAAGTPIAPTASSMTGAPSAVSAAAAGPVATLLPEPNQTAAQPGPGQPAAAALAPAGAGAAQPAASTLLDERFANNDRNWPSSAEGTAFVTNGSYRLAPRQAGQFVAIGAPIANALKDVVVNATFHKLNGPLGGGYGIIVRDQAAAPQHGTSQDGHYYVLELGDKGEVGVWRRDGSQWVDLLPWQPNPAVKPDTASNDVSVRALGNRLTMTVNGVLVAAKTDDAFSSGGVGLFVGGDGNEVAVDRFSIQTP